MIGKEEFAYLEKGLKQRVQALNLFLKDVYNEKRIIRGGVVPADFVYAASGYLAPCEGIVPPKEVFSHVSGIDLVLGKDGVWYILEDNLRVPSGASYPTIARELERRCSPHSLPAAGGGGPAEPLRGDSDPSGNGSEKAAGAHPVLLGGAGHQRRSGWRKWSSFGCRSNTADLHR